MQRTAYRPDEADSHSGTRPFSFCKGDSMQTAEFAIHRCANAYNHVIAQLPPGASPQQDGENQHLARRAFLAAMPMLVDPEGFFAYSACVGLGVNLGVIDPIDMGRYLHLARTAASLWKLAHPQVKPAGEKQPSYPTQSNHHANYQEFLSGASLAPMEAMQHGPQAPSPY